MGGAIVDALSSFAKDAVDTVASKFSKDETTQLLTRLKPMEKEASKSEAGMYWHKTMKDYIQNKAIAIQAGVDAANKLPKDLQPHPMQIISQAGNIARVGTLGQNDALGAGIIKAASLSKNMTESQAHVHAQNLADFTSMILHDTETRPDWRKMTPEELNTHNFENIQKGKKIVKSASKIGGEQAPFSTFKKNVVQSKENPVFLKEKATYSPVSKTENLWMRYAQRTVAPLIIIPHLQNVMNYAISTPLKDLAPAIAETIHLGDGNAYQQATEFARRAGVFSSTSLDAYTAQYLGSRGLVAKYGGDTFGTIVQKIIHNPGFDAARKWQLSIGAAAGKHTVEDFTQKLIDNGGKDKRAIFELQKMGLNINEIMAQKGALRPDQYEKAIYNYVDSKVFLDSTLQRSYYARANPYTRLAFMYHSFVTRQGQLLREELMKPIKTGDWSMIPQTVAVLGVAFPLVGMLTKDLTMIGRWQWSDVNMKKDWDDLTFQNGPKGAFDQVIDDYAHTAGFGILASYVRGGSRFATANMMIGPLGNIAARGFDDAMIYGQAAKNELLDPDNAKTPDFHPLERDLAEYGPWSVDNLGKIFAHQFIPTKKEEAERNPKTKFGFPRKKSKHKFGSFKN